MKRAKRETGGSLDCLERSDLWYKLFVFIDLLLMVGWFKVSYCDFNLTEGFKSF